MSLEAAARELRALALETLRELATGQASPLAAATAPSGLAPMGLFVSLRDPDGEVRGAVGTTQPASPASLLAELVRGAAFEDPRHPPVEADELEGLELELWLLPDPPRRVHRPDDFDPSLDTLRVRRGIFAGTLLPDVALARGWDAATCLAYACRKAGLPATTWRDPETVVEAFRSVRAS